MGGWERLIKLSYGLPAEHQPAPAWDWKMRARPSGVSAAPRMVTVLEEQIRKEVGLPMYVRGAAEKALEALCSWRVDEEAHVVWHGAGVPGDVPMVVQMYRAARRVLLRGNTCG